MASDYQMIRQGIKSIPDFQREEEEFQIRKAQALASKSGNAPAALQIADAYAQARAAGDTQRMNDIAIAAKSFDRGVVYDANGNPVAMGGYGNAVGQIAGAKKAYEANAQNASDLQYDPQIAGGEAAARQQQELRYAGPIAVAKKTGDINATQVGDLQKKADSANIMGGNVQQAREILQHGVIDPKTGKPTGVTPTGSYLGAGAQFFNRLVGNSNDTTKANAALDVIAGNITGAVPRMEGPQSDADRVYYQQQAGRVSDKTLPIADRLASLDAIDRINAKYAGIQTPSKEALGAVSDQQFMNQNVQPLSMDDLNTVPTQDNPMGTQAPTNAIPITPPKKGMVVDGYMFNGGNPSDQKSWKKVK